MVLANAADIAAIVNAVVTLITIVLSLIDKKKNDR